MRARLLIGYVATSGVLVLALWLVGMTRVGQAVAMIAGALLLLILFSPRT